MAATSFTDIAGFTPLVETLEPDVIGPLLNDYLGGMPDVVFAHDGTVGKIVGDAIHMLLARPRSSPTMRCLRWRVDWCHSACNFDPLMVKFGSRLTSRGYQLRTPSLKTTTAREAVWLMEN